MVAMSDFTSEEMFEARMTLNDACRLFNQGRISEEVANGFFKGWVGGKMMYRWANDRPEVCYTNNVTGDDTWSRFNWHSRS